MKEGMVNIKLSDIRPNPNRDLKFNPYNEEKIATLMASINSTGYWTNTIVRPAPDGKGYELAYGHHRLESAKRCGIKEAEFVVRDLDENLLLKMMENENSEDYRYCPLSLLESVKAVVNALAAGRIAPFYRVEDGTLPPEGDPERYKGASKNGNVWRATVWTDGEPSHLGNFTTQEEAAIAYRKTIKGTFLYTSPNSEIRYAPSFVPKGLVCKKTDVDFSHTVPYAAMDIARFLGRAKKADNQADGQTRAALDALYLLEVKAITTAMIKEMNWSQLGKFVADIKAKRESVILRETKTKKQLEEIRLENLRLQAEQKTKEKAAEEKRRSLVTQLAEAETERKTKEVKIALKKQVETQEKITEVFKEKKRILEKKVEQVKQQASDAKQEDTYLPIRKESERIVHLLERRDEEEVVKALAHKDIKPAERERLRQAAIAKGTWYLDWVAQQFLPPLSTKNNMAEYRRREAAKRAAETKETK
jgi:hypothetical protein